MPYLTKKALALFIRTNCKRQLRLNLSPDSGVYRQERQAQGMPPKQPPRPGLQQVEAAGDTWQAEKLHDLEQTFGTAAIVGDRTVDRNGRVRFRPRLLTAALAAAAPNQFIVEAEFSVTPAFESAFGIAGYRTAHQLDYGALRTDIIQVLPAGSKPVVITPDGSPVAVAAGDTRLQLRVIDIKLTAEPSPQYFAEVVYYSTILAGWLVDEGLAESFSVVHEAAIWPGSHEASKLVIRKREIEQSGGVPTAAQLVAALEEDLEPVPFDVFVFRLRKFLREDVPEVLGQAWSDLPWHVDNRCKGCDYLGHPWRNAQGQQTLDPNHCMPMAGTIDHLSRVAFVSRGASAALQGRNITAVGQLATLPPADGAFDEHQVLRATRTVVAGRARSLQTQQSGIPPEAGASAVMPRWADLRIQLSVDFDIGSALTVSFGIKAFWLSPQQGVNRPYHNWPAQVFVIDVKSVAAERRELIAFLSRLNSILDDARQRDPDTTYQIYLWDQLQYDHLARVIGRHLDAVLQNGTLQRLAWLFPPEELLPNPEFSTRRSPITIVRDAVRSLLAAPIPHYYTLFETARLYHDPSLPTNIAAFSVHPLFEDELSDQIPSERAHEIWSRTTQPHWQRQMDILVETVKKQLTALETVTRRLETDLRPHLTASAPRIRVGPPPREPTVSADGQLWLAFAKLNEVLAELEVYRVRAMPPHEREARFASARLERRLLGQEETDTLAALALAPRPGRLVYKLRDGSVDVKLRDDEFNVAISPEAQPGLLDRSVRVFARGTPQEAAFDNDFRTTMEDLLKVDIVRLDRDAKVVVLDHQRAQWIPVIADLVAAGRLDLSRDVILDPTHTDFFTKKLIAALRAIGNPQIARTNANVQRALGNQGASRRSSPNPVGEVLWAADALQATQVVRDLPAARQELEQFGFTLNASQWTAWEAALSRRAQLIWGPPGTGKSRTIRAVVMAAVLDARRRNVPQRVLVCASTYNAMDNVLLPVYQDLTRLMGTAAPVFRLRSSRRAPEPHVLPAVDVMIDRRGPSQAIMDLRQRLSDGEVTTVVGATPEQVHNLLTLQGNAAEPFFDLIVIDEASQMDVAHSILALASIATGGAVVLAGDPKQLPPIHQAIAPTGLEGMVGSVYRFLEESQTVTATMLEQNYRSNAEIVEFTKQAGYPPSLTAWSPQLRLNLLAPISRQMPAGWPTSLYWSQHWADILDPSKPAVCVVYPDGRSSQSNRFEADAVASLLWLLYGRTCNSLLHENDHVTGLEVPPGTTPYTPADFWNKAVGVVTPHRAQQGLIVSRLQSLFASTGVPPTAIRDAVDTVERFQGQQRDVMIASFALGDPDQIGEEDEFLLSLNRFNVMASRARAKLIVLVSEEVVDHLSGELEVLRDSRLLKVFVESFCSRATPATLGCISGGQVQTLQAKLRSHS